MTQIRRLVPLLVAGAAVVLAPASTRADDPPGVKIAAHEKSIDFLIGDDLVARYHIGPGIAKPYFWPLEGSGGVSLTRAYPLAKGRPGESNDHIHHKSVWFGHGDVIPEGIAIPPNKIRKIAGLDFWTEEDGHGLIVCTEVGKAMVSGSHGRIVTRNEWRTAAGEKIMDETRTIQLHDLGMQNRLLVLEIDLLASVVPITFGDTDEGTMGVRINDKICEVVRIGKEKKKGAGTLENAEGKTGEKACWGYLSPWNDYSGPIGDQVVGLALMADPANPYPSCWQSRAYGLMAANPFGRDHSGYPAMKGRKDLVTLARGEHLRLRYGILTHPGNAESGKVADHFQTFLKLKD